MLAGMLAPTRQSWFIAAAAPFASMLKWAGPTPFWAVLVFWPGVKPSSRRRAVAATVACVAAFVAVVNMLRCPSVRDVSGHIFVYTSAAMAVGLSGDAEFSFLSKVSAILLGSVTFGTAAVFHDADEVIMGFLLASGLSALAFAWLSWAAPALVSPSDSGLPTSRTARAKARSQTVMAVVGLLVVACLCNLGVWLSMPSTCRLSSRPLTMAMHLTFDGGIVAGGLAAVWGVL